jgi:tousled-like kinase
VRPASAEEEDICTIRVTELKETEKRLLLEKSSLEQRKLLHIRELKRSRDERCSQYRANPVLNQNYVLLDLLGKGGFSEVFRAFDLTHFRHVACKIHQIQPSWDDVKKVRQRLSLSPLYRVSMLC